MRGTKDIQMPGNRDSYFDNLKGALIMLVVIGHFLLPMEETRPVWCLIYSIYLFHMPMFIMISGYFAKGMYRDGIFRTDRFLRILWLYLIFKVAVHITESLVAGTPIISQINFFSESGAPWYLMAMMWYYLSIPILTRLKPAAVMVIVSLVGIFTGYIDGLDGRLVLDRTLAFVPFFYLGYYMTKEQVSAFVQSRGKWVVAVAAAAVTLLIVWKNKNTFGIYQIVVYGANYERMHESIRAWGGLVRLVQSVMALIMSFGLMAVMPRKKTVLAVLGQRSLQIYILHRLIRNLMQYWGFYQVFTSQYRKNVAFTVALAIVATFVLAHPWLEKMFDKIQKVPDLFLKRKKVKSESHM